MYLPLTSIFVEPFFNSILSKRFLFFLFNYFVVICQKSGHLFVQLYLHFSLSDRAMFSPCASASIRPPHQEDASQEDASIILLFEDVNYKVKSTSKLLRVSRDLLYGLF